jgi:hypothetical protein
MSSPHKYPTAPAGYLGKWNHDRFRMVCRERGVHDPAQLAHVVNAARRSGGDPREMDPKTAHRYFHGTADPTRGSVGKPAAAFELARLLDFDLAWMCSKGVRS